MGELEFQVQVEMEGTFKKRLINNVPSSLEDYGKRFLDNAMGIGNCHRVARYLLEFLIVFFYFWVKAEFNHICVLWHYILVAYGSLVHLPRSSRDCIKPALTEGSLKTQTYNLNGKQYLKLPKVEDPYDIEAICPQGVS